MVISNSTIKIYRISFYLHKKKLYILSKAFTVINRIIAGCYIGANAVVISNVPPGSTFVGIPAKPL